TCPDGYSIIAGQCMSVIGRARIRMDAEIDCNRRAGTLAVPSDPQGLWEYYKQQDYTVGMWIGASDAEEEGVWRWSTGELVSADLPWIEGEPNDAGGAEDAILLGTRGYSDYDGSKHAYYICEPQAPKTLTPATPAPTTPALTTLAPTTPAPTIPPPTTPVPTTLPPTTSAPTTSITVCPSGSVLVGGQCLVFRQEMLTWNGSKKACDANNLNLASLTDPDATLAYILATYGYTRFWVGGNDAATEGLWKWLDGTAIPLNNTQFPWADGQPDSWRGNQDCLSVNFKGGFDDGTCSVERGYICEVIWE
ncbi:unnamed protein product, partial [Meganyctiphanes norvegica]